MSNVVVEYFGPAKDYTKISQETLNLEGKSDLSAVFQKLNQKYGNSFTKFLIESCGIVINYEYIDIDRENVADDFGQLTSYLLQDGDNIVIVPPVSSG